MNPILEAGRTQFPPYISQPGEFMGAYQFAVPGEARRVYAIASNAECAPGMPAMAWEHVSVSFGNGSKKTPSWEVMCYVKDLFWDPETPVMQLHPPRSVWVNEHPGCLHLWRPQPPTPPIPLPHWCMVGLRENLSQTP